MEDNYQEESQEIIQVFSQFKPVPSERFYSRMSRAPWNRKFSASRLVFHISAAAVAVLFLVYLLPNSSIFFAPPHTPTSTQFSFATHTQSYLTETTNSLESTPPPSATPQP